MYFLQNSLFSLFSGRYWTYRKGRATTSAGSLPYETRTYLLQASGCFAVQIAPTIASEFDVTLKNAESDEVLIKAKSEGL